MIDDVKPIRYGDVMDQNTLLITGERIGTVSPFLHGHFAEHLGELLYPGMWAGRGHPLADADGWRRDVVAALKAIGIPVLRWPGGNFADSYRWRDGIGRDRPLRLNTQWGNAPEPNHVGTHEFMALCRNLGAEPYFAGNLGSEAPGQLNDWVEYCNQPGGSTLAAERAANGDATPFNVRWWGIGNENWGAGGSMGPEHYAQEFGRYRTYVHEYAGTTPVAVASGPNGNDWAWTRRLFTYLAKNHYDRIRWPYLAGGFVGAFGAHYYCGSAGPSATSFSDDEWYRLLAKAVCMDGIISGHRAIIDEFDPERKVRLILDEWGTWHANDPALGRPGHRLYQQSSQRDACVAALTLDIFNRRCDVVHMANIAQVVNVLQAMVLSDEHGCTVTPTGHVFALHAAHRGGESLRCDVLSPQVSDGGSERDWCRSQHLDRNFPGLAAVNGSATRRDGVLTVTAVNAHATEAQELCVRQREAALGDAEVVLLAPADLRACNRVGEAMAVAPQPARRIRAQDGCWRTVLPPGAVVRMQG
jgi:alpha-N-arabinofuranosidase